MRAFDLTLGARLFVVLTVACIAPLSGCAPPPEPCHEDYVSCGMGEPCASGATCESLDWSFGSGSTCSRPCEDQLDCPIQDGREGRCLSIGRDGRFACYRTCVSTNECPRDWVCQPIRSSVGMSAVCLP